MARMKDLTVGTSVEYVANDRLLGARGTIAVNRLGLYQTTSGFVWIVWDNPQNQKELVPQWITHQSVRIIGAQK